jgi:YhcH/YjgK/YiaL family protein
MSHESITTLANAVLAPALFIFLLISCTSEKASQDAEEWTDEQASEWFNKKEWLGDTPLQPDPSIDKKDFAIRYHAHQDRWERAFQFLRRDDLDSLPVGELELDGRNVYAIIQEYTTKNPEDAQYESHRHYTDIQHLVSGTEAIGRADLSSTSVKTPYSEEKDIAFYTAPDGERMIATPDNFFIFFPDDAHMPGMKVDQNAPVRKVVLKVKND